MKQIRVLLLMMACVLCMSSCEEEPLILEKDGKILLGDKYVEVATEFTEDQAVDFLTRGPFLTNKTIYIYDDNYMVKIDRSKDDKIFYRFFDNGGWTYRHYTSANMDSPGTGKVYTIRKKVLTIRQTGTFFNPFEAEYEIVGIGDDFIVLDNNGTDRETLALHPELDKDKVKIRNVWRLQK